ncbi:hypothetical protein PtB15_4B474 [Puccinia triticina]|nr:hypothetical protein PtB15_4B474 [Puccinia triticina]
MAINTLVGVSLGNGWSLDQQIGPSSYIDDVLICRPLAQIVDAELAQYSKLMEFDHPSPVTQQAPTKKTDIPAVITGEIAGVLPFLVCIFSAAGLISASKPKHSASINQHNTLAAIVLFNSTSKLKHNASIDQSKTFTAIVFSPQALLQ